VTLYGQCFRQHNAAAAQHEAPLVASRDRQPFRAAFDLSPCIAAHTAMYMEAKVVCNMIHALCCRSTCPACAWQLGCYQPHGPHCFH
jgi:hypothetical protein